MNDISIALIGFAVGASTFLALAFELKRRQEKEIRFWNERDPNFPPAGASSPIIATPQKQIGKAAASSKTPQGRSSSFHQSPAGSLAGGLISSGALRNVK